jgi:hypothetical protein
VLTGQDGFRPGFARTFAPTPQQYQFGVCATASADPHCTVDPHTVPQAIDVITPAGVLQSDEVDYTLHNPVTLQDVTIPNYFPPPLAGEGRVGAGAAQTKRTAAGEAAVPL